MKTLIMFILLTGNAFAVCLSPLSRTNINAGIIPTSAKYNADFNDLYVKANNLPGDCIADGSIREDQIADNAVTTDKITDATITAVKFATGVIPPMAKPLRIRAYTSNATWVRQPDVGRVFVQVVGGGGGVNYNGGNASFGVNPDPYSYLMDKCMGLGGQGYHPSSGYYGTGGDGVNGDINLPGRNSYMNLGRWGQSVLGPYGRGASVNVTYVDFGKGKRAGGGGGYCARLLEASELLAEEVIRINPPTKITDGTGTPGGSGLVIIYEYGK